MPVFFVALAPAFGCEIILVPPRKLGRWWQRDLILLPGCRSNNRLPRPSPCSGPAESEAMMLAVRAPQSNPPIMAFWILRASIKRNDVDGDHRLLAVPQGVGRKENVSCRSRADRGRPPDSPPTRAKARHQQSCKCRRATRAEELLQDHWAGPDSEYPTFRRPASICFIEVERRGHARFPPGQLLPV